MAQIGYTPISLYYSTTVSAVPTNTNLANGELAINITDGKLYYKDNSNVVQLLASKAGSSGDVVGPASSTDNAIPTFDGTTGKLIKNNSGVTILAGVITATGFSGPINGSIGATTPSTGVFTQVDITAQGDLSLQDSSGGEYIAIQAPATVSASYTLTLPDTDGNANEYLGTDGSGVLTWSSPTSTLLSTDNTWTGLQSFTGTTAKLSSYFVNAKEKVTVSATAATGTINYDATTQSVLYYTTNASANWTVNFRASSGTSLNTAMSTGESVTVAFLVTQGVTAYYNSAVQVDGNAITPKWQGGSAPSVGNVSSIDAYVYTIVKTGAATFTVFASLTQFA
jgi:hypothetical protein